MKRPVVLIVGAAAGALLIAAIGASAHTGFSPTKSPGVHLGVLGGEASGARVETPEPNDTLETEPIAAPTAEPAQAPEPADNETESDTDTETDSDTETNDDAAGSAPVTTTRSTSSDEHDGGGSGDSEHKSGSGD